MVEPHCITILTYAITVERSPDNAPHFYHDSSFPRHLHKNQQSSTPQDLNPASFPNVLRNKPTTPRSSPHITHYHSPFPPPPLPHNPLPNHSLPTNNIIPLSSHNPLNHQVRTNHSPNTSSRLTKAAYPSNVPYPANPPRRNSVSPPCVVSCE